MSVLSLGARQNWSPALLVTHQELAREPFPLVYIDGVERNSGKNLTKIISR